MNKTNDLISALTKESPKVKRLKAPPVRLVYWLLPTMILLILGVLIHGLRPDLASFDQENMVSVQIVGLLLIGLFAAYGVFARNIPGYLRSSWVIGVPWCAMVGMIAWLGSIALSHHEIMPDAGCGCAISIILLAVIPSVLQFFMLRRGASLHLATDAGLSFLANLAIAAAAQQLLCPNDSPIHILVWHFLPVAVGGIIGALVGGRLLRWHQRGVAAQKPI